MEIRERVLLSAMNGDIDAYENLTEEQWKEVYELSQSHSLHFFIFDYYDKIWNETFKTTKLYSIWKQEYVVMLIEDAVQTKEIRCLLDTISKSGIEIVLLKGEVIRRLYDNPSVRISGDVDILVLPDNLKKLEVFLNKHGYLTGYKSAKDITFEKDGALPIEVHSKVLSEEDKLWFNDLIWSTKRFDDSFGSFRIDASVELTYLLAHIVKHYLRSGSGIRSLYDVKLYIETFKDEICFEKVYIWLEKLGVYKFGLYLLELCKQKFDLPISLPLNLDQHYIDLLWSETLKSGMYGDDLFRRDMYQNFTATRKNKINIIFLDYRTMCIKYPYLKGKKVLLPLFWGIRIFNLITEKKKMVRAFLKDPEIIKSIERRNETIEFLKDNLT